MIKIHYQGGLYDRGGVREFRKKIDGCFRRMDGYCWIAACVKPGGHGMGHHVGGGVHD